MNRRILNLETTIGLFESEYSAVRSKFNLIMLSIDDAFKDSTISTGSTGVYVFWKPNIGVIKVGKSQTNSKKRALEHLTANTKNELIEMESLKHDKEAKLLLININLANNLHWLLSLEAFMEWNTYPAIKAKRMG